MDENARLEQLSKIPLFADALDREHLAVLAAKAHHVTFPTGSTLMASGDFGVAMFVIVTGRVDVRLATEEGETHEITHLGAGDIVGEMSLMTGDRRNANVTADTEVSALEITKVSLEEIFAIAPQLIDRFSAILATRQAELDRIAAESAASAADIAARIRGFFHNVFRA